MEFRLSSGSAINLAKNNSDSRFILQAFVWPGPSAALSLQARSARLPSHCCLSANKSSCFWIVVSVLLVTWLYCDVAIPCAFTPRKPICEDFSFMKSPPPSLISTIWSENGKASPEGEYLWPKATYRDPSDTQQSEFYVFSGASSTRVYPFPSPPQPLAAGMSQGGREVTENRIT